MHEDLERIVELKLNRQIASISESSIASFREAASQQAALTPSFSIRSGQQEASLARIWMDSAEAQIRSYSEIWVDLIKLRNGRIARSDVSFVSAKVDGFAKGLTIGLNRVLRMRHGNFAAHLIKVAEGRMQAVPAGIRCDLEIMARENEVFERNPQAGIVQVADSRPTVVIQNSSIANLNVGSQVGTMNANLQSISGSCSASGDMAQALRQFSDAVIANNALARSDKEEIVQALSTIREQAAKVPQERSKVTLKAVVAWIPTGVAAVKSLADLWSTIGPLIESYFGPLAR